MQAAMLLAAESASIGVLVHEHTPSGPHVAVVNDAALKLLGRSREELLAMPTANLLREHARANLLEVSKQRLAGSKGPNRFEVEITRPDGSQASLLGYSAPVDHEGKPGSVLLFWDRTGEAAAEAARRAEAERFARMFASAPDGIAIVRGPVIVSINPAGATLLGLGEPQQAIGVSLVDLMLPEEVPMMMQRMKASAQGAAQSPQVYRVHRSDGSIVSAEVSSIPFEHDGQPALLAFVRDVTDRAKLQEQMARAERLASLSTLAAGLAHEVNNPLTAAMLQLDVLEQHVFGNPGGTVRQDVFDRIRELRNTHGRIADIMRDFAQFARTGDEKRVKVDLRLVIAAVERMISPLLKRRATYVNELTELPLIEADPSRIEQVFLNLLLNAVQALPEGREGNEIRVSGRVLGDGRVSVEVKDNGLGITTENLRRVFDPFFTTKPVGVGTGLGLTVSHNIVSAYGGEIQIDSAAGHGCVMRVVLPPAGAAVPRARPRVLVIDDEPHLATTLRLLLQDRHEVVALTQSEKAVALLLGGAPFDAVLCDLMMPDPNGMEVYQQVTAARPELKRRFIFMTGGVYNAATEAFLDTTPAPRVQKPFDAQHVEALIARVAAQA